MIEGDLEYLLLIELKLGNWARSLLRIRGEKKERYSHYHLKLYFLITLAFVDVGENVESLDLSRNEGVEVEASGNRVDREWTEVENIVVDGIREGGQRRWVEEEEDGSEGS